MEANRLNWNDRTAIHLRNSSGFYAIDRVKSGDDLFRGCEDAELGEVAGKRLIHLQCHFGLDTIRLARRGATATGLDFSAPALQVLPDLRLPEKLCDQPGFGANEYEYRCDGTSQAQPG